MKSLQKQLTQSKLRLLHNKQAVFLAYTLLRIPVQFGQSSPTACTDGTSIEVNPNFFSSLTDSQREFLLAHEVMHILGFHATRLGNRDAKLFNIAADYVINTELQHLGFDVIDSGFMDRKYLGWTAEQVYDDLLKHSQTQELPSIGLDINYQSGDTEKTNQIEQEISTIIIQVATESSMSYSNGSIPLSIQRHLDELTKPKVNWKVVLRKYLLNINKADYSWSKPNRRLLASNFYLPALHSRQVNKVSFAIDTSGSVSEKQFNKFLSEVAFVFNLIKPKELDIIQFDDSLQSHETVSNLRQFTTLKFKGWGGTCPQVALDAFNGTNSKVLFVITDGYFNVDILIKPKNPVVWVIFDNPDFKVSFGSVIHVNTTD